MPRNLTFRAGPSAVKLIEKEGLRPDHIEIIAGAAGGPKWLVLSQLDRALFTSWLQPRKRPLFLLGSSIGAFRFAAVSQNDPLTAIQKFEEAYIAQRYSSSKPSPEEVSRVALEVLGSFIDSGSAQSVLSHPYFRLNIVAARCKHLLKSEKRLPLSAGFAGAITANLFHQSFLGAFFERTLFCDRRDEAPFVSAKNYPCKTIPLRPESLKKALQASGSIPFIMSHVDDIPGAEGKAFLDGALLDYHMDVPFMEQTDRIVLLPHFSEHRVPGWLDKYVPWRRAKKGNLHNLLLICPSREFIENLPLKKIPDRSDFHRFMGRDQERVAYWHKVIQECRKLSDELLEVLHSGNLAKVVEPF